MATASITRLAAGLGALAAGGAAVALAALLVQGTPGPDAGTRALTAPAPAAPRPSLPRVPSSFPAPPSGAVVFSREDGGDALALAIVPETGKVSLQASIVGNEGTGVRGLSVSFAVEGAGARAAARGAACGRGCYRATLPIPTPQAADVRVRGRGITTSWHLVLPRPWPPPAADVLVRHSAHVWRSLRSLAFSERLASDPRHAVISTWIAVAPDRLAYRVRGGYAAVIVGGRRWDKSPGGGWIESLQTVPLHQPVPVWQSETDARVLGGGSVRGRAVRRISFFDPATPAWFEIVVDKQMSRTLDLRMTATAHFMHERYGSFDEPLVVRPPS